jgi:hypothetical protein
MAAQQFVEAGRQLELSKIPLFFGDPAKDAFTPETWLNRLEQARAIGAWDAPNTAIYMNMAFRDNAIRWRDGLKDMGIDTDDWAALRAAFLRFYAPSATIRSCVANLDLKQGASETARDFGPRVARVVHDIRQSAQAYVFPAAANLFAPAIQVAAVLALGLDERQAAHRALVTIGEQRVADLISTHIFVAGLKPYLRDKCVTRQFNSYYEAYTHATQLEHNLADPRKATHVSTIDQNPADPDSDPEIAEMELQLDALRMRKNKKQPGRRGSTPRRGTNRGGSTSSGSRDYSLYKCHFCHIPGHLQQVCRKRLASGAPMVAQPTNGLQKVSETQLSTGSATAPHGMPTGTAPPPPGQLPDPQQYFNPFQGAVQSVQMSPYNNLNWY